MNRSVPARTTIEPEQQNRDPEKQKGVANHPPAPEDVAELGREDATERGHRPELLAVPQNYLSKNPVPARPLRGLEVGARKERRNKATPRLIGGLPVQERY